MPLILRKIVILSLMTIFSIPVWFWPASARASLCLNDVRDYVANKNKGFASFDVDYYSQGDLTQKVTGPLRKNRLSSREAQEIDRLSEDKSNAFYQVSFWEKDRFRSELYIVDRKSCAIEKRYVLLGDDFD